MNAYRPTDRWRQTEFIYITYNYVGLTQACPNHPISLNYSGIFMYKGYVANVGNAYT